MMYPLFHVSILPLLPPPLSPLLPIFQRRMRTIYYLRLIAVDVVKIIS